MTGYRVAVVGATGAVGTIMLDTLERRGFPSAEVVPFASERSAGRELRGAIVQPLTEETIQGFDVALFSAGGSISREWAPRFAAAGALVVDNSSAWRMDPEVPLIVSEVNPHALDGGVPKGIVANPNCTTMVVMLPLKALDGAFGLTSMVATSFQAAGGAGQKGIDELHRQIEPLVEDVSQLISDGASAARKVEFSVHENTLAFNVVPLLGKLDDRGLHRRGDEALQRVAQDPRAARPRRLADVRPRARDGRPRRRDPRGLPRRRRPRARQRRARVTSPTSSSSSRRPRWSGPAGMRSRSAACAPTSATPGR